MRTLLLAVTVLLAPAALAQSPTATLTSPTPEPFSYLGTSVASVPDTDGDGRADLLVGAFSETTGGLAPGRAHLYSADGTFLLSVDSPNPINSGDFGLSVAGVPDVDGDRRGDLLVGAPGETVNGVNSAGRAYLFSGATGALIRTYQAPLGSVQLNGFYGYSVAGLDDVNGDGRGDVLIGAVGFDLGATADVGRAYVLSGPNAALLGTLNDPTPGAFERFGGVVDAVPDVDGDGVNDLLVGTSDIEVHVFSGATRSHLRTIPAPEPASNFSRDLAGIPDLDGDGFGDLLVGAPTGANLSRAYAFSGATGTLIHTLQAPIDVAGFGASVDAVAAPDGTVSLVVGENDPSRSLETGGRVHVFDGRSGAWLHVFRSPNPEPTNAGGGDGNGRFGDALASLTDGSFAVGAPAENGGATDAGRAYLYQTAAETASLAGPEGWRLLAAPVAATAAGLLDAIYTQGIPGATSSDGGPSVYRYDESVAGDRDLGFAPLATMGAPAGAGRGLAVYVFEDDDPLTPGTQGGFPKMLEVGGLALAGAPVAFPVSFTPTASVQEDGWNLVGNPFDASLDWDVPGWTKTRTDNVIYVYDAPAGTYRTWNGSAGSLGDGIVAAFQGFWVKAHAADPVLVAPPGARVPTPAPVPPLTAALGLVVEGTLNGTPVSDAAFVSFHDDALAGLDPLDAYELAPFRDTYAALYAEAETVALDVSAVAPAGAGVEVPLGLAAVAGGAPASGTFTLRWPDLSRVPGAWGVSLLDTQTGAVVDLRTQPSYAFAHDGGAARRPAPVAGGPPVPAPLFAREAAAGGAILARFRLRFDVATVGRDGDPDAGFRLGVRPNPASGRATITVTLAEAGRARLAVYDALGREVEVVLDGDVPAGAHEIALDARRLAPGVYVVRWQAGGDVAVRPLTVVR